MTTIERVDSRQQATRAEIEDFLYREAELLDAWALDDWVQLFTEDAKYEVPCNDALDGDPSTDLLLIDDDINRLRSRVVRLNSRRAHREYPHSRTNHQIFNVRVEGPDDNGEIGVRAHFTVWRFRGGRSYCYVGKYRYRLRRTEAGLRICFRRVELDMSDLRDVSDVAIVI
ncbi:snoaL-like domain protein [Mycolicibacterium hassiacum DSM 44199]|jgi:p-cumate 2,3-dioxygenase beta subunit|uniref:SnoaL-like domain protein n=1 Tax=Mycolicibacterium hassiacum (strain DSM 44199 / CIP 105218 / JCM 12690 / 3849) TaxID=1122247 RepID=K5BDD7_MYCHD|nr:MULTISPECIES: aromatic-ring-hydroxylating dioxygenase subunit beta [Mycolicibacterium]PZN25558.1 MAG: aromatic-ring-hydroxylating dioxygenase subunit beta [Mycolicibacterium hassiacum]EID10495.1 aromatic-ring-hydroxylating dioxygenase subunit beta [Mycolicibacterium phlei RIVM601174]EKF25790.1 snoaL-like domain protein [Mycolicibacterium hassiacum DSM 44199]MBF4194797.1 aromatic-ring-hydroxylating dioxygenase subunit beta [Mycolicibacterium phlei]MDA4086733.1 aromatic-ring-hydroxylating dio